MGAESIGGVDVDGMSRVEIDYSAVLEFSRGDITMGLEPALKAAIQQEHLMPDGM